VGLHASSSESRSTRSWAGDRRGGDRDAELEQLAFDPQVAPPGVLPGHPKEQVAYSGIDPRTSWPPTRPRPFPAHELPTPPGEGVGGDRKRGPPLPREEPAGRGQEGPVGRAVARSLPPPAQDTQLMAQHDDLQVPIIDAHAYEQAEQPRTGSDTGGTRARAQSDRLPGVAATPHVNRRSNLFTPHERRSPSRAASTAPSTIVTNMEYLLAARGIPSDARTDR